MCTVAQYNPASLRYKTGVKKRSCVFMSEYVCGKSGCLHLGRLNSWAKYGTALVGKSDEKDTEVAVKLNRHPAHYVFTW